MSDVARKAGVSVSTVSRVIAGDPRISEATRGRVLEAVRELDFHAHSGARDLARRQSRTIGVVVPGTPEVYLANPFFPELLRGLSSVAGPSGFDILLHVAGETGRRSGRRAAAAATGGPEANDPLAPLRLLQEGRAGGLVLLTASRGDPLLEALRRGGHPFVLVGRPPDGTDEGDVPYVNNDNFALARMATGHLLAHGHRRVALLNGPRHWTLSIDREAGYRAALASAGLPVEPGYVRYTDFSAGSARRAMRGLLELPDPPSAIFAIDDNLAAAALLEAERLGKRVPQELSFLGVNDTPLARYVVPALSVMKIPVVGLGRAAARLLIALMEERRGRAGPARRKAILPARLVERQSCGPILAQGRGEVVRAQA